MDIITSPTCTHTVVLAREGKGGRSGVTTLLKAYPNFCSRTQPWSLSLSVWPLFFGVSVNSSFSHYFTFGGDSPVIDVIDLDSWGVPHPQFIKIPISYGLQFTSLRHLLVPTYLPLFIKTLRNSSFIKLITLSFIYTIVYLVLWHLSLSF